MAAVYNNYRIIACSVTAFNINTTAAPLLYIDCDPMETYNNPTNSKLIADDTARIFSPKAVVPQVVTWNFPGTGATTNIWMDTASMPSLGQITIGNNTVTANGGLFDMKVDLVVQFANPK